MIFAAPLTRRRKLALADLLDEPWAIYPADSLFGALIAQTFRANGCEPPRPTVATLSFHMQMELLATGRFLTVLPDFMLTVPGPHPPIKALPVTLRSS